MKVLFFLSVSFIIFLNKQDEANKLVEFYLHIKFNFLYLIIYLTFLGGSDIGCE